LGFGSCEPEAGKVCVWSESESELGDEAQNWLAELGLALS